MTRLCVLHNLDMEGGITMDKLADAIIEVTPDMFAEAVRLQLAEAWISVFWMVVMVPVAWVLCYKLYKNKGDNDILFCATAVALAVAIIAVIYFFVSAIPTFVSPETMVLRDLLP